MENSYLKNIKNTVFTPSTPQDCVKILPDGTSTASREELLTEHYLQVYLNESLVMELTCTPTHLEELVLGRLYSEGMIRSIDEIDYFYLCESGNTAKVFLKETLDADHVLEEDTNVPTCCTNNKVYWKSDEDIQPVVPIEWHSEWIFKLAETFEKDTSLHKQTYGTHSSFLAVKDKILFISEDIGRHNAIDKVIGMALKEGLDLTHTLVFTSGRVPTDMVAKVIRARIPIFISKAAPTKQSVELASQYNLTLIAGAHSDKLKICVSPMDTYCQLPSKPPKKQQK